MKKHAQIFMMDGVGINLEKFKAVYLEEKLMLRSKYKYEPENFIILYIAEFIPRKDHEFFIKNIPELKSRFRTLK